MTVELTADLVERYRQVLAEHMTTTGPNRCPVCGVRRCPPWVDAYDALAAGGHLMAAQPPPWTPYRAGAPVDRQAPRL